MSELSDDMMVSFRVKLEIRLNLVVGVDSDTSISLVNLLTVVFEYDR